MVGYIRAKLAADGGWYTVCRGCDIGANGQTEPATAIAGHSTSPITIALRSTVDHRRSVPIAFVPRRINNAGLPVCMWI